MMARGFKPVGWVAGVASAALGCYMLSLNVASERAELAKLERSIITTQRDIRTLQTELETRGRMQQLENWNANVLALSAPTSAQYLDSEVTLARFEKRDETFEERSEVHMATAPVVEAPKVQQKIEAPVRLASAPAPERASASLIHRASLVVGETKPATKAVARPTADRVVAKVEEKKLAPVAVKADEKKSAPVKTAQAEKKAPPARNLDSIKKVVAEKAAQESTKLAAKAEGAGGR